MQMHYKGSENYGVIYSLTLTYIKKNLIKTKGIYGKSFCFITCKKATPPY